MHIDLFDGFILAHLFLGKEEALWKQLGTMQSRTVSMFNSDFMTLCLHCTQSIHGEV